MPKKNLQEAITEIGLLKKEIARLRQLVLEQTSIVCSAKKYWPEWVNKYFDSLGPLSEDREQ